VYYIHIFYSAKYAVSSPKAVKKMFKGDATRYTQLFYLGGKIITMPVSHPLIHQFYAQVNLDVYW